jgi:hypothetical protein
LRTGAALAARSCGEAARGGIGRFSSHGGGARCVEPGCGKATRVSTACCSSHGGGTHSEEPDCGEAARGAWAAALRAGAARAARKPGCGKAARKSTARCSSHGGGARCEESGCGKSAVGSTTCCVEASRRGTTWPDLLLEKHIQNNRFYRLFEAGNEKYCYVLHARSGLRYIIRLQDDSLIAPSSSKLAFVKASSF